MSNTPFQHLVHDYYVERLRQIRTRRRDRLERIRTPSQAREYQREIRRAIRRAMAPRPRKTALNAQITGTTETRDHRIENILFHSRPGSLVSANLYLPRDQSARVPAVLGTCGHDAEGKEAKIYQEFCQRLTRAGFAVLIYDPFNQGERDQYWHLADKGPVASCTHAHNMMGKQLELNGEFFGMWRVWDGIRALDYLLARPEIDPTHIGLTGNSGGGTVSTWLWPIEERITMAAPSCFITTFMANLENELPADCEQYPPGVIGAGLEIADFLIARAPDPVLLLGQTYDFFDRRGLDEAYAEIARFYEILGAPATNHDLFIGPQGHGFSHHNQESMVQFFARQAGLATPSKVRRPQHLTSTELDATPQGNTVAAGAIPIYEQIAARADGLALQRKKLVRTNLIKRLTNLLCLPPRNGVPHYRVLRPNRTNGRACARYAVETEANIRAILHKRLKTNHPYTLDVEREVELYVPHISSADDLGTDARDLCPDQPLYALDVRGLGESRAEKDGFFHPYGMDYLFHGHALLLGESYLGRRVYDLLRTLDLLTDSGARKIHLYGRGQGALLALCAGLLHPQTGHITLKNAPLSWIEWTRAPLVFWPAANFLRNALHHFDLPDLYRALGRRLILIEPWGPDMQPLCGNALKTHYAATGLPTTRLNP